MRFCACRAEELATALAWPLDRTAAASDHAAGNPALGGPMTLQRLPGDSWTVTERLDLLSADQERDVANAVTTQAPMTVDEANALLAAYAFGSTPDDARWADHLEAVGLLKRRGLPDPVLIAARLLTSLWSWSSSQAKDRIR